MRASAGFTLLEVTVASSVVVLGILTVLGAMALNVKHAGMATDTRIAVRALRQRIEELEGEVCALTAGNVAAFLAPAGRAVPGLLPRADGTPAETTVRFLTEAETDAFLGASGGGVDLDWDGARNESDPPPTAAPLWKAYGVRVRVAFGDRAQPGRDRALELTTIIVDRDG